MDDGASLFWGPPPSTQDLQDCPPSSSSPPSFSRPPTSSSSPSCGSLPLRPVGEAEDDDTKGQEAPCSPSDQPSSSCLQSPVLGESASMYYHPDSSTTPQDQQRFYQDLLGQVTSRLQLSGSQEVELGAEESRRKLSVSPEVAQPSSRRREQSSRGDPVVSATLSQLQQLGVSVDGDLTQPDRIRHNTVESASTLACINPAAVLPRLSLAEPVGSTLFPGGSVDLSLEANAIALRYLTDSQLCRLSLGSHAARPCLSSPENSLLSPSNMSLATKRYMRRYGLIEEESSEEEQTVHVKEPGEQEAQARQPLSEGLNVKLLPQSLTWDLRPKMQFVAGVAKPSGADKENCAAGRPSLGGPSTQPEGSVGNFLDLSRLRQLPKLF